MRDGDLCLVRQVLDRQLVDRTGLPCGKVCDLQFRRDEQGRLHLDAILVGAAASIERLPALLRVIARPMARRCNLVRIPWQMVDDVGEFIKINATAHALGLGEDRTWAFQIVKRLPMSWKS